MWILFLNVFLFMFCRPSKWYKSTFYQGHVPLKLPTEATGVGAQSSRRPCRDWSDSEATEAERVLSPWADADPTIGEVFFFPKQCGHT